MNTTGKVVIGVLAGFTAGAIVGILFAPKKGSVTRRYLVKKGEDYTDAIRTKFNDLVDDINDTVDKLRNEVEDFTEKSSKTMKKKYEDIKSDIKVS